MNASSYFIDKNQNLCDILTPASYKNAGNRPIETASDSLKTDVTKKLKLQN